jgi:hypothetical protein
MVEVPVEGGGRSALAKRLDAIGWGAFFIWIGVVLLVKAIPEGVGSVGVGIIVLGGALARLILGISVSMFWVIIGAVFLLAGIGELFAVDLPLLPVALIICGLLLLFHQRSKKTGERP